MAVAASKLTSGKSATDAASRATASITPTANRLLLAVIHNRKATAADLPTCSGAGLTWVQVATVTFNTAATQLGRLTIFRAMGAGAPGVVTFDFGGQTQTRFDWAILEFTNVITTGADGADAVIQSATATTDSGGSLTVTLGAFASTDNATFGACAITDNIAITEGPGYTELSDDGNTGPAAELQTQWISSNDTTPDWSWATGTLKAGAIAVEIAAGASGLSGNAATRGYSIYRRHWKI